MANGATLYLVDQPGGNTAYDGPAGVNVDSFTLTSGSTLQLQLPSSTLQAAAQAAFPYVNANAVTGRVRIAWDPARTPLSRLLSRLDVMARGGPQGDLFG